MTKGVRLGPFRLLEAVVEIDARFERDASVQHLARALEALETVSRDTGAHVITTGGRLSTVGAVLAELDDLASASASASHAVLHAAAVSRGDALVVLPGASGAGKSTLAAALVQAGWSLASDELVPLSFADGGVEPYPIGPRLRKASWRLLGVSPGPGAFTRWAAPLDALRPGAKAATRGEPAAIVLFDRAAPAGLSTASRAVALDALCRSCVNLATGGSVVWDRLRATAASTEALALGYRHPHTAAELLTAWADG